jgi:hypothetical protein
VTTLLVGAFALVASTFPQAGPPESKPWINQIRVAGDTVWFEGDRGSDSLPVRYCLARRRGNWCKTPRADRVEVTGIQVPRAGADSVVLTPGLALVCRPPIPAEAECASFSLRAHGDTSLYPLVPRAGAATLKMLQRASGLETDEPPGMSESITAWAAGKNVVWFGLGGGFPEGYGAYGGLLRFDRTRRTLETIVHAGLASATITGLAIDGDTLWVGTFHPAELGPVGSTGVLCRDLRTGRWTTLDAEGAWLPDRIIHAIAAHDGMLYIATSEGLAAFDTRSARWSVRYFSRKTAGGSVRYELVAKRPRD